jgi:thiol-disulfide isomerase/thioredoxin
MKKIMLSCVGAMLCLYATAQQPIGLLLQHANYYGNGYPATTKNKYVILDFFATWCSPCIAALPHLDSLQQQFRDDLQIIAVTSEPAQKLRAFFKAHPRLQQLSIDFIHSDSVIANRFPHQQIPHEVLLDKNLETIVATYAAALTTSNIGRLVNGDHSPMWPIKNDRALDNSKPLFNQLTPGTIIHSSVIITEHIPGAGSSSGIKRDSSFARYYFINMPLLDLLQVANSRAPGAAHQLHVADTTRFIRRSPDPAFTAHLVCYEITVPLKTTIPRMHQLILSDLQSRFNISTTIDGSTNKLVITQTN